MQIKTGKQVILYKDCLMVLFNVMNATVPSCLAKGSQSTGRLIYVPETLMQIGTCKEVLMQPLL